MAARKAETGVVKKKKKQAAKSKTTTYTLPELPPVTVLREAYICAVDEPRRWARMGMASSALPKYAQAAAWLCRGNMCFFCGQSQEPVSAEKLFLFHPQYPLCLCLAPFRKMAFDYVENWDSVEGKKQILALVDAGKVALDTPIYQYFCQCGEGPVVVDYRTIAFGLRTHQKHTRRRLCGKCYQNATAKRSQLKNAMHAEAARANRNSENRAKRGPEARINKIKQAKNTGLAPAVPPLPPLSEVMSDAQIAESIDKHF